MTTHRLPFENRWTSGKRAWQWSYELDQLGLANVRAMFVEHEIQHGEEPTVIFDIPAGFVRDWLRFQDRRAAHRHTLLQAVVVALCLAAMALAVISLWRP